MGMSAPAQAEPGGELAPTAAAHNTPLTTKSRSSADPTASSPEARPPGPAPAVSMSISLTTASGANGARAKARARRRRKVPLSTPPVQPEYPSGDRPLSLNPLSFPAAGHGRCGSCTECPSPASAEAVAQEGSFVCQLQGDDRCTLIRCRLETVISPDSRRQ